MDIEDSEQIVKRLNGYKEIMVTLFLFFSVAIGLSAAIVVEGFGLLKVIKIELAPEPPQPVKTPHAEDRVVPAVEDLIILI
jgi:hypothetical protein